MENKAIIILRIHERNFEADLEVPLDISANELVGALNYAYDLGINTDDVMNSYIKIENPIALLRGSKTLREYGVHNGTIINIT